MKISEADRTNNGNTKKQKSVEERTKDASSRLSRIKTTHRSTYVSAPPRATTMQAVEIMVQEAGSHAASRELGLMVHEMDGAVSALPAAPLRAATVARTLWGRGRR